MVVFIQSRFQDPNLQIVNKQLKNGKKSDSLKHILVLAILGQKYDSIQSWTRIVLQVC